MKIGLKILLGIILSAVVAFVVASIKGEIPFVEGASGILVFLLPIISIALIIGLENPKERTSKFLIVAGVVLIIFLIAGLMFI